MSYSGEHVSVRVEGQTRTVRVGTPVGEILPVQIDGLPVVAALLDRKAASLSRPLTSSCEISALTTHHWEGQRILRHSLALLVLEAARDIAPGVRVTMGPSVGFGQRILLAGDAGDLALFGAQLEERMRALVTQAVPLKQALWTVNEARDHFLDEQRHDAEHLLATWRDAAVGVVSYGSLYAIEMGPLLPTTAGLGGSYILQDEHLLLLVYGRRGGHPPRPSQRMPSLALSEVGETQPTPSHGTREFLLGQARAANGAGHVALEEQAWLRNLGISSVGGFNRACVSGSVPEIVHVGEGFQEKRLGLIADEIYARANDVDIVSIAGPSSSGKTTFIRRLCTHLQVNGITPVPLGLDDYYVDREQTPTDSSGDYDYEALDALQLRLLHQHLEQLLAGESVQTPRYDFRRGKSQPNEGRVLKLGKRDVLLLEGIHGLNPALLGNIARDRTFSIFVCPLMQLAFDHASRVHASDVRLIRRIVRDRRIRGLNATETITRWPKVRTGERTHIYPHQPNADAVFDTSLIYELGVLRVYAERYLLEVSDRHPAHSTAFRLMHLLDRFVSIYPEQVPGTSILREFIGGSSFDHA